MNKITSPNGISHLVELYHVHLKQSAGLSPGTCANYVRYARDFLNAQLRRCPKGADLGAISTPVLLSYLTRRKTRYRPITLQQLASCLRSFFRFLVLTARCPAEAVPAIPAVKTPGAPDLPEYLTVAELGHLLQVCDRRTRLGLRNQAILVCLARLGLRAGEVAQLNLEDIDWQSGTICLRHPKGRRERLLPLSQEVGSALAAYLQRGRPATQLRQVFLLQDGQKALSTQCISALTRYALQKARISRSHCFGPHLLRHTFASHLLQSGASLKAIADLLGHRSLETTRRYTQVNWPLLSEVMQPWPMEVA